LQYLGPGGGVSVIEQGGATHDQIENARLSLRAPVICITTLTMLSRVDWRNCRRDGA